VPFGTSGQETDPTYSTAARLARDTQKHPSSEGQNIGKLQSTQHQQFHKIIL